MEKTVTALQAYREKKGLTLRQFSGSLKACSPPVALSAAQLSRIEREGVGSMDTALALSRVTGISLAKLAKPKTIQQEDVE